MDGERIGGTWRIVQSTDPLIQKGVSCRFAIVADGLELSVDGAASYEIPWGSASVSAASNGQTVVDTGRGTVWVDPQGGADPQQFAAAVAAKRIAAPVTVGHEAFEAGDGQLLVLYRGSDDGSEVDPALLFKLVSADAATRAGDGWRLVSMVGLPLRHGGQVFGLQGGGFTTKVAMGCLYARATDQGPNRSK